MTFKPDKISQLRPLQGKNDKVLYIVKNSLYPWTSGALRLL